MSNGAKSRGQYKVLFSNDSQKYYEKLTDVQARRIDFAISRLSQDPYQGGDINKLKGMPGFYRLRVGDLRIIFEIYEKQRAIWVDQILPRGQAYK